MPPRWPYPTRCVVPKSDLAVDLFAHSAARRSLALPIRLRENLPGRAALCGARSIYPPSDSTECRRNGSRSTRRGHGSVIDACGFLGIWVLDLGISFLGGACAGRKAFYLSAAPCVRKVVAPHAAPAEAELSRHRAHYRDGFPARD